ncbi:MAG TPA: Spx/MgsR family RNA polymerase-binding regulatory protein [Campylobacterales bacterium]|nr:Spx/MgsR family RNA polymerase-binding regulatory protein [Campylobacterales bacterium]
MTIYGIKNCDSVKKAVKYMKNRGLEYNFVDFKLTPVGDEKINSWLQYQNIDKLFNARSTTYRNLKLKELGLSDKEKADWMAKENLLIKRPVIEYDGKVLVGFNQDQYKEIFI